MDTDELGVGLKKYDVMLSSVTILFCIFSQNLVIPTETSTILKLAYKDDITQTIIIKIIQNIRTRFLEEYGKGFGSNTKKVKHKII
jgi:hypothetical protein